MKRTWTWTSVLVATGPLLAQTAPGELDPDFGIGGQLQIDFAHSTDIANGVALQPDGKLVVVGQTYTGNDYSGEDFAVSRRLPDGRPDPSFGVDGRVTTDFPGLAAVPADVVVQPDGKIVVAGGAFPLFTFLGDVQVVRYNADGSLDSSFGDGGIVTTSFPGQGSYAFDVALQPDGKIVAAGTHFVDFSSSQSSDTDFAIARYHPDGSLDTSFGGDGKVTTDFEGFNDDIFSLAIQPDGKLVAVGSALDLATFYDFAAARYLPNGALDGSFGSGGKVRTDFGAADFDRARSVALQADGKIVASGFTSFDGGLSQPFALVRWDASGNLDPGFDGDGLLQIDFGSVLQAAHNVLIQPNGKIVATGFANTESSDSDFLLARCHPDGSLDTGFSGDGKVRTSFGNLNGGAHDAELQPDGKIVAVGFNATFSEDSVQFALARYVGDPAGWVDMGGGLAGTLGLPVLVGAGDLVAGSAGSIELSDALPRVLAGMFLAVSSSPVPFHGGTLLAFPHLALFFASTGPDGAVDIPYVAPTGIPPGTEIWLQWAVVDAGAVQGVALSNAIRCVAP